MNKKSKIRFDKFILDEIRKDKYIEKNGIFCACQQEECNNILDIPCKICSYCNEHCICDEE
tara:strand:- start:1367 stop:1549 length:183 start_codon:yes stop_codon:yes gene_type:complete